MVIDRCMSTNMLTKTTKTDFSVYWNTKNSSNVLLCFHSVQSVYSCTFCWFVLLKCAVCVFLLCSSSSRSLTSSAARRGQTETNAANFLVWWVQVLISLNLSLLFCLCTERHFSSEVIVESNLLHLVHNFYVTFIFSSVNLITPCL